MIVATAPLHPVGETLDSLHHYCLTHGYFVEAKVLAGYRELRAAELNLKVAA